MNIHEHQAKELLRKFGAPVPNGIVVYNLQELKDASKKIKTSKIVLKAQIHAGGRGKAGGVKVVNNFNELKEEARELFGKVLVTHHGRRTVGEMRLLETSRSIICQTQRRRV